MNDYKPSSTFPKPSAKLIQLVLTGVNDSLDQSTKSRLITPISCITPRVLKVVEIGDFWAKRTMPPIRLQGKWMMRAGVLPNRHVQITNPSPGVLIIQLLEECSQNLQAGPLSLNPNIQKK